MSNILVTEQCGFRESTSTENKDMTVKIQQIYYNLLLQGYMFRLQP